MVCSLLGIKITARVIDISNNDTWDVGSDEKQLFT